MKHRIETATAVHDQPGVPTSCAALQAAGVLSSGRGLAVERQIRRSDACMRVCLQELQPYLPTIEACWCSSVKARLRRWRS